MLSGPAFILDCWWIHCHKMALLYPYFEVWGACTVECSEKNKSFKLEIPQPDSERRHSSDLKTVFGIIIGQFSSCEIGKT